MEPINNQLRNVLEFSLLIEIKILKDNKWDVDKWPEWEHRSYDTNIKLSSKDFNNKLRMLSILMNTSKKETFNYLKTKVKELYN